MTPLAGCHSTTSTTLLLLSYSHHLDISLQGFDLSPNRLSIIPSLDSGLARSPGVEEAAEEDGRGVTSFALDLLDSMSWHTGSRSSSISSYRSRTASELGLGGRQDLRYMYFIDTTPGTIVSLFQLSFAGLFISIVSFIFIVPSIFIQLLSRPPLLSRLCQVALAAWNG